MMARILASTESPPRRTPAKGLAQTHVFGSETGAVAPSFLAMPPHAPARPTVRSLTGLPARAEFARSAQKKYLHVRRTEVTSADDSPARRAFCDA